MPTNDFKTFKAEDVEMYIGDEKVNLFPGSSIVIIPEVARKELLDYTLNKKMEAKNND